MIEINWKEKTEKLWQLLDDIDTASDMIKPNNETSYKDFYDYAMKKCAERNNYMKSLDGQTLTACEQEIYDQEVQERIKFLNEWKNQNDQNVMEMIEYYTKNMTELEEKIYRFKWSTLVQQDINMWIQINKPVSNEQLDRMCELRRFDTPMKNYLKAALEITYLREGMKLPITKK